MSLAELIFEVNGVVKMGKVKNDLVHCNVRSTSIESNICKMYFFKTKKVKRIVSTSFYWKKRYSQNNCQILETYIPFYADMKITYKVLLTRFKNALPPLVSSNQIASNRFIWGSIKLISDSLWITGTWD